MKCAATVLAAVLLAAVLQEAGLVEGGSQFAWLQFPVLACSAWSRARAWPLELQTNLREDFAVMEKALLLLAERAY